MRPQSQLDARLGGQRAMQDQVGAVILDASNVEIERFGYPCSVLRKVPVKQCRLWPESDEKITAGTGGNCDVEQLVTDTQALIDHLRRKQVDFRRTDEPGHVDIVRER